MLVEINLLFLRCILCDETTNISEVKGLLPQHKKEDPDEKNQLIKKCREAEQSTLLQVDGSNPSYKLKENDASINDATIDPKKQENEDNIYCSIDSVFEKSLENETYFHELSCEAAQQPLTSPVCKDALRKKLNIMNEKPFFRSFSAPCSSITNNDTSFFSNQPFTASKKPHSNHDYDEEHIYEKINKGKLEQLYRFFLKHFKKRKEITHGDSELNSRSNSVIGNFDSRNVVEATSWSKPRRIRRVTDPLPNLPDNTNNFDSGSMSSFTIRRSNQKTSNSSSFNYNAKNSSSLPKNFLSNGEPQLQDYETKIDVNLVKKFYNFLKKSISRSNLPNSQGNIQTKDLNVKKCEANNQRIPSELMVANPLYFETTKKTNEEPVYQNIGESRDDPRNLTYAELCWTHKDTGINHHLYLNQHVSHGKNDYENLKIREQGLSKNNDADSEGLSQSESLYRENLTQDLEFLSIKILKYFKGTPNEEAIIEFLSSENNIQSHKKLKE